MKSQHLVGFEWTAQYITDVTNVFLFEAASPENEVAAVQFVINEMAKLQRKFYAINAEKVRDLLFTSLESSLTVVFPPEAAEQIPLPVNVQPLSQTELAQRLREAELQRYSTVLERHRLRERNIQFAGRLVSAALELEGWFHWVPGGPKYKGETSTFHLTKKTSEGKTNRFVSWIKGGGNEPDRNANMNCWEAVFFAAFKAGLVNLGRLRQIHDQATLAAQGKSALQYFDSLTDSLGYQNSFPFVPSVGLCPSPGDIVFVDRHEHVALCVGIGADIIVMSHWKHPKDSFHRYPIEQFSVSSADREVRFGSMPL